MAKTSGRGNVAEIGRSGLKYTSGVLQEEFLPELKGDKALRVYREMSDNDATVAAMLFAIRNLIRQVDIRVEPGGKAAADKAAADLVREEWEQLPGRWSGVVDEAMAMLVYGYSLLEVVYRKRPDGKVGWARWAGRSPESRDSWVFDENGMPVAWRQRAHPDFQLREIPLDKCIHLVNDRAKGNPEGRSILRGAYQAYHYSKRIQVIEAIGIERDLAGLPVAWVPPQVSNPQTASDTATLEAFKRLVRDVRVDEQGGLVMPLAYDERGNKLYDLTLLTGGGKGIDTTAVLARYAQRIASVVLADFILLGSSSVGSFALSADKTDLFAVAVAGWLDSILGSINSQAVPRLLKLNGLELEALPTFEHGDVEQPDLAKLGSYLTALAGAGVPLFPDETLEESLLQAAGLPISGRKEARAAAAAAAEAANAPPEPNAPGQPPPPKGEAPPKKEAEPPEVEKLYDPRQDRWPAGTPQGGKWRSSQGGGGEGGGEDKGIGARAGAGVRDMTDAPAGGTDLGSALRTGGAKGKKRIAELAAADPDVGGVVDMVSLYTQGSYGAAREAIAAAIGLKGGDARAEVNESTVGGITHPFAKVKEMVPGRDAAASEANLGRASRKLMQEIADQPADAPTLYRGLRYFDNYAARETDPSYRVIKGLAEAKPGDVVDFGAPTSFTTNRELGDKFAHGKASGQRSRSSDLPGDGIVFEVQQGARALPVGPLSPYRQSEMITSGRFRVVSVEWAPGHEPRKVTRTKYDENQEAQGEAEMWHVPGLMRRGQPGVVFARVKLEQVEVFRPTSIEKRDEEDDEVGKSRVNTVARPDNELGALIAGTEDPLGGDLIDPDVQKEFNPGQPRYPAGDPRGGQFAPSTGGGGGQKKAEPADLDKLCGEVGGCAEDISVKARRPNDFLRVKEANARARAELRDRTGVESQPKDVEKALPENSARTPKELAQDAMDMAEFHREVTRSAAAAARAEPFFGPLGEEGKDPFPGVDQAFKRESSIIRKVGDKMAEKKINEEEAVKSIGDAVRSSVIVDTPEQVRGAVAAAVKRAEAGGSQVYVENRFDGEDSSGYGAVHLTIAHNAPSGRVIRSELQVHIRSVNDGSLTCVKERAHALYEISRDKTKPEGLRRAAIESANLLYLSSYRNVVNDWSRIDPGVAKRGKGVWNVMKAATVYRFLRPQLNVCRWRPGQPSPEFLPKRSSEWELMHTAEWNDDTGPVRTLAETITHLAAFHGVSREEAVDLLSK